MSEALTEPMFVIDPMTTPIPRPDFPCAWCRVRLAACGLAPKPYFPADTPGELHWYHPIGCIAAARNADAGIRMDLGLPG